MKKQTGLILEGGGMRGVFTAGVLDAFMDNKISFDNVIGVSAGACHACSFLSNQYKRAFDVNVNYLKDKRYCSLYSLFKTGDIFGADFIYNVIPNTLNFFDYDTFKNKKCKFEAVLTNIKTGKAEYKEVKDAKKDMIYVRAGASLPLLSRAVKADGNEYLDGGISDSVPIVYYRKKKIDKIIVVLTRPLGYRKKPNKYTRLLKIKYKNYPNLINSIMNRSVKYNKTMNLIEKLENEKEIFVIRPPKGFKIGRLEKNTDKLEYGYHIGYESATKVIKELKEYLK